MTEMRGQFSAQTGSRLLTGEADKTIKIWREDETAVCQLRPRSELPTLIFRAALLMAVITDARVPPRQLQAAEEAKAILNVLCVLEQTRALNIGICAFTFAQAQTPQSPCATTNEQVSVSETGNTYLTHQKRRIVTPGM